MNIKFLFVLIMSVILSGCSTEDNETSTSQNPDPVNNNPTVITAASLVIENTGANGITVSFSVSEEGSGSGITEVGVVWSSNPNPTINDNKVSYSSAGSYRSQLAFLNDDTTYYMRSYGTNSGGTIYGTESSISTLPTSQALVYDGDITLTSQQEVIDFGYQNYSKVTGTLAIWGYNYIDSLTPLQTILRVNKLDISGCLGLENLNGLEHLHTIDGSLTIFANEGLLNFNGLNSLTEIGDELDIHNNAHLISISNLLSLTNIPGNLKVVNNDQLPNLQGLQQIDSVGGVVKVSLNDDLTDISAIAGIQFIGSTFDITGNQSLINIQGFNQLSSIGLDIQIVNNSSLTQINGFNAVTAGIREIEIRGNVSMESLNGFAGLVSVEDKLIIRDNISLTSINAFGNLASLDDYLGISNNTELSTISGFNALEVIDADIYFAYNNQIIDLNAFSSLRDIGDLSIVGNQLLVDFCALTPLIANNGVHYFYVVEGNGYNPTKQDILNGDCSL